METWKPGCRWNLLYAGERLKPRPIRAFAKSQRPRLIHHKAYVRQLKRPSNEERHWQRMKPRRSWSLHYRSKEVALNIHHAKVIVLMRSGHAGDCTVFAMGTFSGFLSDCLDHTLLRDEIRALPSWSGPGLERHRRARYERTLPRIRGLEPEDLGLSCLGRKRNGHGRVCSPADFVGTCPCGRKRLDLFVTHSQEPFRHSTRYPISGTSSANIYSLRWTFDGEMIAWVSNLGGSYGRYSDDIRVILLRGAKGSTPFRFSRWSREKMLA